MKRYLSILAALVISSLLSWTSAQVKGHTYYALDFWMDDNVNGEILLEVEKDGQLALGQIMYSNGSAPIRLYGHRERQDKNKLYVEEHLASGQWVGKINLTLADGVIIQGQWSSVVGEDVKSLHISKVKPFPYSEHKTFFHPVTASSQMGGHFINYIRQGKVLKEDHALNIIPYADDFGFFSIEQGGYTLCRGTYNKMGDNEFMVTDYEDGEQSGTIGIKVYEDFARVSVVFAKPGTKLMQSGGFYVREEGVLEQTVSGINDDLYSIRARLENGHPSLIVSKRRLMEEGGYFGDSGLEKGGRYELNNLQGQARDILLADVGMDIVPIFCVLLDDGRVQFMSTNRFRETGEPYLSDPLPNLANIVRFSLTDPNFKPAEVLPSDDEEEEYEECDESAYVYAISASGESYPINVSWDTGDFMLNPKNTVDCDGYIHLGEYWDIHLIVKEGKEEYSYFGGYWIEEVDDNAVRTVHYIMNQKRNNKGDMQMEDCYIDGSFTYEHDDNEWQNIHVQPVKGLQFTPKGKRVMFTFMDAVG